MADEDISTSVKFWEVRRTPIGITDSVDRADDAPFELASISLGHSLPVHVQCHSCEENPGTLKHRQ
jgi:hypothetical protein